MAKYKSDYDTTADKKPEKEITLIDYIATIKSELFKKNSLLSKYNAKYSKDLKTISEWKTIII